jgi:GTP-binding protein
MSSRPPHDDDEQTPTRDGGDVTPVPAINRHNVHFVKGAVRPSQYPTADRPDIAVAGRSNVGKSALLNTLLGRRRLARVSGTPGKTRMLNFFDIDGAFYLVDLPGYGYARRAKSERQAWRRIVEDYVDHRKRLRAMLVLIDIRRGPEEEERILLRALADWGIRALAVLTKADKLPKSRRRLRRAQIADELAGLTDVVVATSSKTGLGRDELWSALIRCLAGETSQS